MSPPTPFRKEAPTLWDYYHTPPSDWSLSLSLTLHTHTQEREYRRQRVARQRVVELQRKARERTSRLLAHLKQQVCTHAMISIPSPATVYPLRMMSTIIDNVEYTMYIYMCTCNDSPIAQHCSGIATVSDLSFPCVPAHVSHDRRWRETDVSTSSRWTW